MTAALPPIEFNRLVANWSPRLLNYLTRFLWDRHLAEDVLQEVWMKAYKHYDPTRLPGPWLYKVARNTAVDLCRRNKLDKRTTGLISDPAGSELDPADAIMVKQGIEWTRKAIESLPSDLRRTAELVAIEGKSCRETAKLTGTPLSTVKSRMTDSIPDRLRRYGSR